MLKRFSFILFAFLLPTGLYCQGDYDVIISARALIASGNPSQAESVLTSAINTKASDLIYRERAEVRMIKGNMTGAISDFISSNTLLQYSGEYGLERVYARQGNAAEAVKHLVEAIQLLYRRFLRTS